MRLIDGDKLIEDLKHNLFDWETVNGITSSTVLRQVITDIRNQPEVRTDGMLYYECLRKDTKEGAVDLFLGIIQYLNKYGNIPIIDLLAMNGKFESQMDWRFADSYGWTKEDISNFTINKLCDGKWEVFLGKPHPITD